jgi:hypothetical protein
LRFAPEDAGELCRGIAALRSDPKLVKTLAARGPAVAGRYDRAALAASMLSALEAVAAPGIGQPASRAGT